MTPILAVQAAGVFVVAKCYTISVHLEHALNKFREILKDFLNNQKGFRLNIGNKYPEDVQYIKMKNRQQAVGAKFSVYCPQK